MGPVDEECASMLPRWMGASYPLCFLRISSTPSPYQLNTIAAAPSDFIAKSEGALEEVRRWYGAGTAMVACSLGHEAAHLVWVSGELLG